MLLFSIFFLCFGIRAHEVQKLNGFSLFSGMLLRYFLNFYDMEIIEEEAFLSWKEDVTQEYPGKGKALFQVTVALKAY